MFTLQELIATTLWIIGLASFLATVSYAWWYGRAKGLGWRLGVRVPRILVPFCVSLELFSIGLAMNGITAYQPAPRWEVAVWSVLALLFAIQSVVYGLAGRRFGWDKPVKGEKHDRA